MYKLVDFITKKSVSPDSLVFTGKDSPWEVLIDLESVKSTLNIDYFKIAPPGLAKYLPLMPIQSPLDFVSLKEMATPLIKSKTLGKELDIDLYFKVEGKNPTGSFKDRGSAVDISVAKEFGAKAIILASTGNMAASCACYAAAAKIPCFVLVPEDVPVAKLAQVIAFGGHIVQIKGTYNDAARLAKIIAEQEGFYLAGDYAYRVEGQKTAAFEIADQLFFEIPDILIVPIGCGTNIAAYAKGFHEYHQLGFIDKIPKLIGVEAEGAAAVVNSYQHRQKTITPLENIHTIASAIAVPNPIDGIKALDAIYSTAGYAIAVSDQEILEAQYSLSTEEGLFVETSSAATLAALKKILSTEKLSKQKIVCILTGDGLKDSNIILKTAIRPPTIYPNEKEFFLLYHNKFFENKSRLFIDTNRILFDTAPTVEELTKQLKNVLNVDYSNEYVVKIHTILCKILQKGKFITISDFQDIVQSVLETPRHQANITFSVLDFEVKTGKDRTPEATVKVKLGKEKRKGKAIGVGPVDAVINALTEACKPKVDFKLVDYKVDIRSHGVDAVVYVELKLIKDHAYSLGHGASSDIIQASIEAFEEAYNGFIQR